MDKKQKIKLIETVVVSMLAAVESEYYTDEDDFEYCNIAEIRDWVEWKGKDSLELGHNADDEWFDNMVSNVAKMLKDSNLFGENKQKYGLNSQLHQF